MTHDTPDGTDERRLWCRHCELSVEPSTGAAGPECPACGTEL
jgi:predicted RNA-binding Zn-ribbon protein involved in translation (DUF1610 family)